MYLVANHLPIYTYGKHKFVQTHWLRSLRLLRDSLGQAYGRIAVIAPSRPFHSKPDNQEIRLVNEEDEDFELITSFDERCGKGKYWSMARRRWQKDLRNAVGRAEVVHSGMDDLFRPISYFGFLEAKRQNKPTVFVQDRDVALQVRQLNAGKGPDHRILAWAYSKIFEQLSREAVGSASVSLIRGNKLMKRYEMYQRNAKEFQDTNFSMRNIIDRALLDRRVAFLRYRIANGGSLRLVSCVPLKPRFGILEALQIVKRVRDRGVPIEYDIIGQGGQRASIETEIKRLNLSNFVRVLGRLPYGQKQFEQLQKYDAQLYTPRAEGSSRRIFDGYAAGLPLIAFDIPSVIERHEEDSTTFLLPFADLERSATRIIELAKKPDLIAQYANSATVIAKKHCVETWYRRRAIWTFEAVDEHRYHTSANDQIKSPLDSQGILRCRR